MKNLFLAIAMLFAFGLHAQEKTEVLNEKKIGWITLRHTRVTKSSGAQEYIHVYYQNLKYKQLTDLGGFIFSSSEQLSQFMADIKKCTDFIATEEKASYSVTGDNYILNVYDFAKETIYITDIDNAYTSIEGQEIQMILDWLTSVSLTASL